MGCVNLPKNLKGWGQYCDCLESTKQFQYEDDQPYQSDTHSQGQSSSSQKKLQSGILKKDTPPSYSTSQKLETPVALKFNRHLNRSKNKQGQLKMRNISKRETIEELSDISQIKQRQENIFDVQRFQQDEQIKQRVLPKLYNPVALTRPSINPRSTGHLIQNFLHAQKDDQSDKVDTIQMINNNSYFIDEHERNQFNTF